MSSKNSNGPIPLIEIEGNDSMKSNPEALHLLRSVDSDMKVHNNLNST